MRMEGKPETPETEFLDNARKIFRIRGLGFLIGIDWVITSFVLL